MFQTSFSPVRLVVHKSTEDRLELSRLMAAAAVNPAFARLLLDDPETALRQGYQEETFLLTEEERALILSIRADSLPQLAQILLQTLEQAESVHLHYTAQTEQYCTR